MAIGYARTTHLTLPWWKSKSQLVPFARIRELTDCLLRSKEPSKSTILAYKHRELSGREKSAEPWEIVRRIAAARGHLTTGVHVGGLAAGATDSASLVRS